MLSKVVRTVKNPAILVKYVSWKLLLARIALHNARVRPGGSNDSSLPRCLPELQQIQERIQRDTDISDHLPTLFAESLAAMPKLIVELGVRGGDSTFVLERVARLCRAKLLSVDIEDCSNVSDNPEWMFIQRDDITFAAEFPRY